MFYQRNLFLRAKDKFISALVSLSRYIFDKLDTIFYYFRRVVGAILIRILSFINMVFGIFIYILFGIDGLLIIDYLLLKGKRKKAEQMIIIVNSLILLIISSALLFIVLLMLKTTSDVFKVNMAIVYLLIRLSMIIYNIVSIFVSIENNLETFYRLRDLFEPIFELFSQTKYYFNKISLFLGEYIEFVLFPVIYVVRRFTQKKRYKTIPRLTL